MFSKIAHWAALQCGRSYTFAVAIAVVIVWAATGPLFQFSDTWQLVINTGTTVVTFLMVFLIQHTQNVGTQALQLKMDELIRVNEEAHNRFIGLEDASERELEIEKQGLTDLDGAIPHRTGTHP